MYDLCDIVSLSHPTAQQREMFRLYRLDINTVPGLQLSKLGTLHYHEFSSAENRGCYRTADLHGGGGFDMA